MVESSGYGYSTRDKRLAPKPGTNLCPEGI
jgi:hypothetical protein